ncbi:MAG TPA: hypothetical protein V6C72_02185, partial [Chroococcales cyanobacterium]
APAKTVKTYDQDGKLSKVEVYDKNGAITATNNHTAAENIREKIEPVQLQAPPASNIPQPTHKSAPNPYRFPWGDYDDDF